MQSSIDLQPYGPNNSVNSLYCWIAYTADLIFNGEGLCGANPTSSIISWQICQILRSSTSQILN